MPEESGVAGAYHDILELARPYLATRDNQEHTEWSVACAWELLTREGGDAEVVIRAVILHDVGWSALSEEQQMRAFGPQTDRELNRVHEVTGARIAAAIAEVGYDPELSEEIVEIVRGHDSRLEALSRNDGLVKDADKLFRLSRLGFSTHGRRFFGLNLEQYLAVLAERYENWFFTPTARELAGEAFADLSAYLSELEEESDGSGGLL